MEPLTYILFGHTDYEDTTLLKVGPDVAPLKHLGAIQYGYYDELYIVAIYLNDAETITTKYQGGIWE